MLHGGDIYSHNIRLDFSVNINPSGASEKVLQALGEGIGRDIEIYPDIKSRQLVKKLSEAVGVNEEFIIPGNGASELFMAVIHAIRPKDVLIPVPSFYGYRWVCDAVGANVSEYPLRESDDFVLTEGFLNAINHGMEAVFLSNPNNPNGAYVPAGVMVRIAEKCRECGCILIIDECFMELSDSPDETRFTGEIENFDNVIIIRAFTKSFGIPGVRLGYAVCSNEKLRYRISSQLPEWNVSAIAQRAGLAALDDTGHIREGRRIIAEERDRLKSALEKYGRVFGSNVNFLMVKSELPLYERLKEKGILIRDCSNFAGLGRGYYRFAVKDKESNDELIRVLGAVLEERT